MRSCSVTLYEGIVSFPKLSSFKCWLYSIWIKPTCLTKLLWRFRENIQGLVALMAGRPGRGGCAETLPGKEEWAIWTSSWVQLDPDKSCQQYWFGSGGEPSLLKEVGWPWSRRKGMIFSGEMTWKTSYLKGHSRDRHIIIINIDWRPERWWVLLRT